MRRMLLVVVLLSGCTPAVERGVPNTDLEIPEQFVGSQQAPPAAGAWMRLGGKELEELQREALEANHDLKIAVANVEAARAGATIAGADRWPQLNGSARAGRNQQVFVGLPIPGTDVLKSRSTSYGLSLESSWELDLWNKLGQRQKAAVAELQASEADLLGARLSIAGLVSKAWFDLTELQLQKDLASRTLDAFSETEAIAFDRYERGLISPVDVHLTRTSRENAAALLALREDQLQKASRRLELLLGRYPAGAQRGGADLPALQGSVPAGLPAELLLRRPDLLAAQSRLAAAGARVAEAKRNLLPSIRLTGSAGTTSNEMADLLNGDFGVWSIAGSLLQPLFQGGRLRAVVRQNAAREDMALATWASAVLSAFADVESALAAERHLEEREARLHAASQSASAAWQLSEERYRQGVGNLLSVLEAQRRALDAESQWLSVRNSRLQTRVDLHLALGGGFELAAPDMYESQDDSTNE